MVYLDRGACRASRLNGSMHALGHGRRRRRRPRRSAAVAPLERAERILPYPKFMRFTKLDRRGAAVRLSPLPNPLDGGVAGPDHPGWASELLKCIGQLGCVDPRAAPADVLQAAMIIQRKYRTFVFRRDTTEKWNVLCSFRFMVEHFAALRLQTALARPWLARRLVASRRHAWHTRNSTMIQCLARQHLAINKVKRIRAKRVMLQLKGIVPGGKMSRLLLTAEEPASFSKAEAERLSLILRTILQPPNTMPWTTLVCGSSFIDYLAQRNEKRRLILAERRRVALQVGKDALNITEVQRLAAAETGKKAAALRSEISRSREAAETRAQREEREIMWREDQRVVRRFRLLEQLQDVATAVSSVCLDQALYLVGSAKKRRHNHDYQTNRLSPGKMTSNAEMTYLET